MDENAIMFAIQEGKAFKIGDSFIFAGQIPDKSVGCSGSRCSNCGIGTAFINQICKSCNLPFAGPSGFPDWPEWNAMSPGEKRRKAQDVYSGHSHGRLGYAGIENVPMSKCELCALERSGLHKAKNFEIAHGVSVQEIRRYLRS